MNFFALINNRHSCRQFDGEPIETSQIDYIKSVMMTAPSAGNLQAYAVLIVTSQEKRKEVADASYAGRTNGQSFLYDVPLFMIFFAEPLVSQEKYGSVSGDLYSVQDATIACNYAQLAATDLGLGSVWIGAFQPWAISKATGVSPLVDPVAILAIGHSKSKHLTSPAKSDKVMGEI